MAQFTDEELAGLTAKGDADAFSEHYGRYKASAVGFAQSCLKCRSLAEDAAQDALLSVYLKIGQFNSDKGSFKTWFFTILHHQCIREARRRQWIWWKLNGTDEMPETGKEQLQYQPDINAGIDIRAALRRLSGKYRTAVILTKIHGLSVHESAQVLGINENNVKQRIFRGIAELKTMLDQGTSIRGVKSCNAKMPEA
jgi:RNA polymerase sigma factor (sigma-70 family)